MTISLTKDEIDHIDLCLGFGLKGIDDDTFNPEVRDEVIKLTKSIRDKIEMAITKEVLKKVTRQLNRNPHFCEIMNNING